MVRKAAPGQQRPRGTSRGVLPASGHPRARRRLQGRDSGSGPARRLGGPGAAPSRPRPEFPRGVDAGTARASSTCVQPGRVSRSSQSAPRHPESARGSPIGPRLHPAPLPCSASRAPTAPHCRRPGAPRGEGLRARRRRSRFRANLEAAGSRGLSRPPAALPQRRRACSSPRHRDRPPAGRQREEGGSVPGGETAAAELSPAKGPRTPGLPGDSARPREARRGRREGVLRAGTWGSPRPGAPRPRLRS